MPELTNEQQAAVESVGKSIVSASAGSGKTFVMIAKICDYIQNGGDVESILAITYTQKAAAQMKEKLRLSLIDRLKTCEEWQREHVKRQLSKVAYADVSTVHSFCSRLIRTYFYTVDIDGSFDVLGDDGSESALRNRAVDDLFERMYNEDNGDFLKLLSCYRKKRSDNALKYMLLNAYSQVRNVANYTEMLENAHTLYDEKGFMKVCREYHSFAEQTLRALISTVTEFESGFFVSKNAERYAEIFAEMRANMQAVIDEEDIFEKKPPLYSGTKPRDGESDKEWGELFTKFKDGIKKRYDSVYEGICDRQTEYERFLRSGELCVAFCKLLLSFDSEYSALKRSEGKLDYGDLEHYTLKILAQEDVRAQICGKYAKIFVDEFQDVNPVQERIIDAICQNDAFFVGDVKQAIYGFRGCKSRFFSDKFEAFTTGEGNALLLSSNFRSSDEVINFVNKLFSQAMTEDISGFSYKRTGVMRRGGLYPSGIGKAEINLFDKGENEKQQPRGIYSVKENSGGNMPHSRLSLAILKVVEDELKGEIYDLKTGAMRPTQTGDICILTRKRSNEEVYEIARALKDAGYTVDGSKEDDVCQTAEVKTLLDMLSFIDNAEQDIPMCAFMLSPIGGFCEEELARIRIAFKATRNLPFRSCVELYGGTFNDAISKKIKLFYKKYAELKSLSKIVGAGSLIDVICEQTGWEAEYSRGAKLKNIRALQSLAYASGGELSLAAFLAKIKDGGSVSAPDNAQSGSIKIMTMHSSKGLEFPIVIIADICSTFKGNDIQEIPFDDYYGFAPKWYDTENMTCGATLLRKLCKLRASREEIKNELNLFYVACTRAMFNLHVLTSGLPEYNPADTLFAKSYSQFADFSQFGIVPVECAEDIPKSERVMRSVSAPDERLVSEIESNFYREYAYEDSCDLPVKSSASQVLQTYFEDGAVATHKLFAEDEVLGATNAERGTAYHRFLQLCDFDKKSRSEIEIQLKYFNENNLMTGEQVALVSVESLEKILNMQVFKGLDGMKLYREREFLCRLKACDFLPTQSDEWVLVQGAIDLLAIGDGFAKIIDYKHSAKSSEGLVETYSKQLALYKKAVSVICKIPEEKISTAIVNIYRQVEIILN